MPASSPTGIQFRSRWQTLAIVAVTLAMAGVAPNTVSAAGRVGDDDASTSRSAPTADRFVIEAVLTDGDRQLHRSRTIYREGVAVEINGDGSRFLTVYDDDDVTLLDRMNGVRAIAAHSQLVEITDRTAELMRGSPAGDRLGVDAKPVRKSDVYSVAFGPFEYRIHSDAPPETQMVIDYAKCADAAARLNLIRGSQIPPFARLAVSRELVRDGRLPTETHLTIATADERPRHLTSRLRLAAWTQSDAERFESAMSMKKLYQTIAIDQFEPF